MACYNRQHTKVVFHLSSLSWAKPLEQGYSVEPLNLALKLSGIRQSSPEEEAISSFNFLFNFFVAIKVSFLVFCLFPAAFQLVKQQTQGSLSSSLPVILGDNLIMALTLPALQSPKRKRKDYDSSSLCHIVGSFALNWPLTSFLVFGRQFLWI